MKDDLKNFYNQHSDRKNPNLIMSEQARNRVKEKIFNNLGSVTNDSPTAKEGWVEIVLRTVFRAYVLVPVLAVLFITGATYASANALPGDTLYGVKRQVENAQLLIAPSEESKLNLQEQFVQRRIEELEQIQVRDQSKPSSGKQPNRDSNSKSQDDDTAVDIDSENVSSGHKQQNQRRDKAQKEAEDAVESLQKARDNWQHKGDSDRAKQIEDKVQQYRQRLEENRRSEWQRDNTSSGAGRDRHQDSNEEFRVDEHLNNLWERR